MQGPAPNEGTHGTSQGVLATKLGAALPFPQSIGFGTTILSFAVSAIVKETISALTSKGALVHLSLSQTSALLGITVLHGLVPAAVANQIDTHAVGPAGMATTNELINALGATNNLAV